MDDVRAVMDAAGIARAGLLGYGSGGSSLALFFAATHPDRTIAVCTDPSILARVERGYPWGVTEREQEESLAALVAAWGEEDGVGGLIATAFGDEPGDAPRTDPALASWCAKFARFSATPTSFAAFDRSWFEIDVRDVLHAVRAPAAVLYKTRASSWRGREWGGREHAEYLAALVPAARLIGVDGSAPVVWVEEPEPFVRAVESFLAWAQHEEADLDRILATVLFTDIVASTETASTVGDRAWKHLVERHHSLVRALLSRHRGVELDTAGDGFYATFDGPARAVRCARAITEATGRIGLDVRAGLHTGELELIDGKPGGIAVSIGARIAARAGRSQVLVSQTVRDVVVGSGLLFESRSA